MNSDRSSQAAPGKAGFMHGGEATMLFAGTANYYAAFRRPYPPNVVSYVVDTFKLDGTGRLLDAGAGTGQVFLVLAKYFAEVFAFDQDPEMVRIAQDVAAEAGLTNVTVEQLRAEDLDSALGPFRLAVFAASFHWMDRVRVAELVYDALEPGGHIAIFAPGSLHEGSDPLAKTIQETVAKWLGTERRAGSGVYVAGERHAQALAKTRFGPPVTKDIYVPEEWTIDQIVGWLFSTSFANRDLLGDKAAGFEDDLRKRLLQLSPSGVFVRNVEHTVIWASRPA